MEQLDVTPVVVFSELMYHPPAGSPLGEWLELRNALSVDVDLSEWRLAGGVQYDFPVGTIIPGGEYLVVRAEDAGVQSDHVYSGHLSNGGERIDLVNNAGRLMDAVEYDDDEPWPVIADGSGLSLAKRGLLPSWSAESWGASGSTGGTPGMANEAVPDNSRPRPVLNEVSAAGAACWAEILLPAQPDTLDYSLAVLGKSGAVFPLHGTGLVLVRCDALGISLEAGDLLLLLAPSEEVLDGVRVDDAVKARTSNLDWSFPARGTPGSPNPTVPHAVVINEVMYEAPLSSPAADLEWIELRNAGTTDVDLQGWQLSGGVGFEVNSRQLLPPGGLLLVVNDLQLGPPPGTPPGAVVLGPWTGSLSNKGERVQLLDRCGNVVDEVEYFAGGALWPEAAAGGGASLERRHADSPGRWPSSWSATAQSLSELQWQVVSYSAVSQPSAVGPDAQWNELVIGLLDAGEVLLDDVRVSELNTDGSVRAELLLDGTSTFDDASAWRWIGTHRFSEVVADPLASHGSDRVLRLVATGATGHMHNHLETTLRAPVQNGHTYQISYRACWVQGSNQLNTRLYFDRLARTTDIQVSSVVGSPGMPNAADSSAPSPHVSDVRHSPVVPQPGDPVAVSATVQAAWPQQQLDCHLEVSIRGNPVSRLPMIPTADGRLQANVPAQPTGTVVSFRVVASTSSGTTTSFPPDSRTSSALYRVGPRVSPSETKPVVHVILKDADEDWFFTPTNLMSNDHLPCTVVHGEDIFYNAGVRGKSSERGRVSAQRLGFGVFFDPTKPLFGAYRSAMLDRSEGQHPGQREWVLNQAMARSGSVSTEYNDLVHVVAPRSEYSGAAELQLARFGNTMLDRQFPHGGDGQLFEYELIYYPTSGLRGDAEGPKLPQPDSVVGAHRFGTLGEQSQVSDKEQYRWVFLAKNNRRADNYAPLLQRLSEFDAMYTNDQ